MYIDKEEIEMLNRMILPAVVIVLSSLSVTGCGDAMSDSPEGTVRTVFNELENNNAGVIWDAMPASYQSDVESLIHDAAAKIDADVYDKALVIANKAVDVLKDKRDFILGLPMLQQGLLAMVIRDQEELKKNWNDIVEIVDLIASSELETHDSLKSLDVDDFLSGTGSKIMVQLETLSKLTANPEMAATWDKFGNVEVNVKSTDGDKAVIELKYEGEDPVTMAMVKVEGKWVPEDIASDWKRGVEETKAEIAQMTSFMTAEQKTNALAQMAEIETIVDQLAKAETQEEFNKIVMSFMGGM